MNLTESIRVLTDTINKIALNEEELGKAHLTHPEDVIFIKGAVAGVDEVVARMNQTLSKPVETTIKWDGSPALIFGYGSDMKFRVMDKHMFDKIDDSGRSVYSPKQFAQYDMARGVERGNLAQVISLIWNDLQRATPKEPGYYWCDLLWPEDNTNVQTQPQSFSSKNPIEFLYFKPNPTGILYRVESDSDVGKMISGKRSGIAVHQFISGDSVEKAIEMTEEYKSQGIKKRVKPTDLAQSLNGTLGNLKPENASTMSILPSKMAIAPNFDNKFNQSFLAEVNKIKQFAKKKEKSINSFVGSIPGANITTNEAFQAWLMSYINYEVKKLGLAGTSEEQKQKVNQLLQVIGRDFPEFVETKLPQVKNPNNQQLIINHIQKNQKGMMDTYSLWAGLYRLKMMFYNQIDVAGKQSPVKGFIGKKNDIESQEGYVAHGLKYVDRLGGFSAQHLSSRG